jgi:hypothetical protein
MRTHGTVREGTIAGLIGATSVALWFFIVDAFQGRLLYTPTILGRALTSVLRNSQSIPDMGNVAIYTVLHYAVFIGLGIVAMWVIHASDREPSVLTGLLFLFVVMELGIHSYLLMLNQREALASIAWYHVGIANLLAAAVMGAYFVRGHPEIAHRLNTVIGGR